MLCSVPKKPEKAANFCMPKPIPRPRARFETYGLMVHKGFQKPEYMREPQPLTLKPNKPIDTLTL